jgi:hypothetical protein
MSALQKRSAIGHMRDGIDVLVGRILRRCESNDVIVFVVGDGSVYAPGVDTKNADIIQRRYPQAIVGVYSLLGKFPRARLDEDLRARASEIGWVT